VYEYIIRIPSFVFDHDPETTASLHEAHLSAEAPSSSSSSPFVYPERGLKYRLTPEKTAAIRATLACFKGTLNYQNFTRKKGGFLKDQNKERVKWVFQDGKQNDTAMADVDATPAAAPSKPRPRKGKDDASEDESEGLDGAQEEALERQQFAAQQAAAAAKEAAASSASPSPFAVAPGMGYGGALRPHNLLYTNLKSTSGSRGGDPTSQTNKMSGQYVRFIRYFLDFDIEATYLHSLPADANSPASSSAASTTGLKFVRFRIHGQPFMWNQIRKMIGIPIMIVRGQLPIEYLTEKAFKYVREPDDAL
jgi:hypothetical protein